MTGVVGECYYGLDCSADLLDFNASLDAGVSTAALCTCRILYGLLVWFWLLGKFKTFLNVFFLVNNNLFHL